MTPLETPALDTPVALFIFNRPETTQRVFQTIAAAKPRTLLVVADGPRTERDSDAEACAAARAITDRVDWRCDVLRHYSDRNLGCRTRVSSGIDWVFSQVPEAILLEDDCLPSPDFFTFCSALLERYRNDDRVMHIGGTSFQRGNARTLDSYYFSKYTHIWGWATWRRAWTKYDVNLCDWPRLRNTPLIQDWFDSALEQVFWIRVFDELHAGGNTWDGQWTYACWANHGLGIVPAHNLVSNIGFGAQATHTVAHSCDADMPVGSLELLSHPRHMIRHKEADVFAFEEHYGGRGLRDSSRLDRRLRMAIGAYRRRLSRHVSGLIR